MTRSSREDSEENLSPGPPASVFWSGTLGTRATDGDNETSSLSLRWRVLFGGGDRHARRGSRFVIIPRDLLANPGREKERGVSLASSSSFVSLFSFRSFRRRDYAWRKIRRFSFGENNRFLIFEERESERGERRKTLDEASTNKPDRGFV